MNEPLRCDHCRRTRSEHGVAEAAGEVHHAFDERHGAPIKVLEPSKEQPKPPPGGPHLPSDPVLRLILVEKGLVTASELDEMTQRLRTTGLAIVQERQDARDGS